MSVQKLKELLLESPLARAVVQVVCNALVAVLSGAFVFQISTPSGLDWTQFHRQYSFYALVLTTLIIYWYNRALYQLDRDVLKFADAEYCVAYVRSKCLPEAAEQYRTAIRSGNRGELTAAMQELKRVLK